jgi:hypothetical protein
MLPFGALASSDWSCRVTSVFPVGSIDAGTCTTGRPPGRRGRVPVPGVVCGVVRGVVAPVGGFAGRVVVVEPAPESDDDPLQAAVSASTTSATANPPRKGLQAVSHPVDSMAMEATQLYPAVRDDSRRPDLETRVAELERVVATLATLRDARLGERRDERPARNFDPVALTAALHGHGRRAGRRSTRRSSDNGTLAMRVVLFDPPRR